MAILPSAAVMSTKAMVNWSIENGSAASIIGAPELLSALTDVTSFSSGRVTTYCVLLVFYTAVVMIVVVLCGRLQIYLQRRGRAA